MYILYEAATGYGLFKVKDAEDIGKRLPEVQKDVADLGKFGKYVEVVGFHPFKDAKEALENIKCCVNGKMSSLLKNFLVSNITPNEGDGKTLGLGVLDKKLATNIQKEIKIKCQTGDIVEEITRGIRFHEEKLIKGLEGPLSSKSKLGLGHAFSRDKVQFNSYNADNMIIHTVSTTDQMDKDINQMTMRVREWYGWCFPELYSLVSDPEEYVNAMLIVQDKSAFTDEKYRVLLEYFGDERNDLVDSIRSVATTSMGTDMDERDYQMIGKLAKIVAKFYGYRRQLGIYLSNKMGKVAPNLTAVAGETVGARLIAHAGSLSNLSKLPSSTVQILGAEKALFRALKTRSKTPKYGILYHAQYIGKAKQKDKGRISRLIANKCAMASRLDTYLEHPDSEYGEAFRSQVEERLKYLETGEIPRSNEDVIVKIALKKKAQQEKKRQEEQLQNTAEESEESHEEDAAPPPKIRKGKQAKKERPSEEKSRKSSKKSASKDLDEDAFKDAEKLRRKTISDDLDKEGSKKTSKKTGDTKNKGKPKDKSKDKTTGEKNKPIKDKKGRK